MRVLTSHLHHPDIWVAPVRFLTPLVIYPEEWSGLAKVFRSLDESGMRNPLVCFPLDALGWNQRAATHPTMAGIRPHLLAGRAWAIKFGNQRWQYLKLHEYTHVATALVASENAAVEWKQANYL